MKKTFFVILLIIVVLLVGFCFYRNWLINLFSETKTASIGNIKVEDLVFADEKTDKYEINVVLPLFIDHGNQVAIDQVNKLLSDKFQETINSFKSDSNQNAIAEVGVPSLLQVEYEVVFFLNNIVSLRFNTLYYVAGMAHPNAYYESFNYDLRNNKQIVLADLFNAGSDYLTVLSILSREDLKIQMDPGYYSEDFVNPGTKPNEVNFSVFNFDKDKLIITFDQCQVGPCAAGEQFVEIPYDKLVDVIGQSDVIKLIR